MNKILITAFLLIVSNIAYSQSKPLKTFLNSKDTNLVGKVIELDSNFAFMNYSRVGAKYFYGIHHCKIGIVNPMDSLVKDTIIIAFVYNLLSEHTQYFKNFGVEPGKCYILDLSIFSPCHSDFPKLQGKCDLNKNEFYPDSKKIIKKYKKIYRVINCVQWDGQAR